MKAMPTARECFRDSITRFALEIIFPAKTSLLRSKLAAIRRVRNPTIILVFSVLFSGVVPVAAQSWSNGYARRRAITIDHTKVPNTDQSNFPVLISGTLSYLATTANGGYVTNANGYDIIFTSDAAGTNTLAFEQESYNSLTGAVNYWVKVPTVSHTTDTVIYLFYENSSITTDQSNKTAVWDSNYVLVSHLSNNAGSTTVSDSTSNGNNLTNQSNTSNKTAPGAIGNGLTYNGTSDYSSVANNTSLNIQGSAITLEVWVKPTNANGASGERLVVKEVSGNNDPYARYGLWRVNASSQVGFGVSTGGAGSLTSVTGGSLMAGGWAHVVGIYDGSSIKLFVNGSQVSSTSETGNIGSSSTPLVLGADTETSGEYFNGVLDEARVSNSARSADWIAAEYNNQSTSSAFYTIGADASGGPNLTSLSRLSGSSGTSVTLTGTNFGSTQGSSTITFNGTSATVSSWSVTSITATVPSGATTGSVLVMVSSISSNGIRFIVTTGYGNRRSFTIDHTKVPNTDQVNFPVLISGTYSYLATTPNSGNVTNSNGYDIIFTSDAAGLNILPFEQESYNAVTGAVSYWVQVPTVSHTTDTVIYMFYGNSAVTTDQSNKTGVWDSNFVLVSHMSDNAANQTVADSTSNGNNLADQANTNTKTATGEIANALTFNGSSDYASKANNSSLNIQGSAVTVEVWAKPTNSTAASYERFISKEYPGSVDPYVRYGLNRTAAGSSQVTFVVSTGGAGSSTMVNGGAMAAGTWMHIVGVYNGSTATLYINGSSVSSSSKTGNLGSSATALGIGWDSEVNSQFFNGVLDEVRVSNSARSADWIATEYNNESSRLTFYSVGVANTPTISSLSPSVGTVGTTVTIAGLFFGSTQGSSTVSFNGTAATPTSWSATSISVPVPTGATSGNVVVTVSGVASNAVSFLVPGSSYTNTYGYSNSRRITIDHTKAPHTDQVNFPVLLSGTYSYLATTSNGGNVTNSNGYDIIFTSDPAGTNILPFEQESYNPTTGAVVYWVKIPLVSHTTDTMFYLFYGKCRTKRDYGTTLIQACGTCPMEADSARTTPLRTATMVRITGQPRPPARSMVQLRSTVRRTSPWEIRARSTSQAI